jgi:regulator of protease activity HflC (stomatin/prohibitin superfamily)
MGVLEVIFVVVLWALLLSIPIGAAVFVGRMVWFSFFERAVVFEFQQGLKYKNGRFVGVIKPGGHWIRRYATMIVPVDMREQLIVLDGLEVIPSDNVPTRVNAVANYRVVDPVAAFTKVVDYEHAVHNMVQAGLRKAAFAMTSKDVAQQGEELGRDVIESTRDRQRDLGVSLTTVEVTA